MMFSGTFYMLAEGSQHKYQFFIFMQKKKMKKISFNKFHSSEIFLQCFELASEYPFYKNISKYRFIHNWTIEDFSRFKSSPI